MRSYLAFVLLAVFSITIAPVTADFCTKKCDAQYVAGETLLLNPFLRLGGSTSRNFLNKIGVRTGNGYHAECLKECGQEEPSQICKHYCDVKLKLTELNFSVAPSGVAKLAEAAGIGVSEQSYQNCITDCLAT